MADNVDILAIAAHRDDVEQTCGGTLLKMVEARLSHRHSRRHTGRNGHPRQRRRAGPRSRTGRHTAARLMARGARHP